MPDLRTAGCISDRRNSVNSSETEPRTRSHAIGSLEGLNALTEDDVIVGLKDAVPGVRERAVLASEKLTASDAVLQTLVTMTDDENAE